MPRSAKPVLGETIIVDDPATDEVFLDDTLEDIRCAGVVPGALRINYGDGATRADPKAIGLGAVHFRLCTNEAKLLQPGFQKRPGLEATATVAALGLRLVGAKEYVALYSFQPKRC